MCGVTVTFLIFFKFCFVFLFCFIYFWFFGCLFVLGFFSALLPSVIKLIMVVDLVQFV